ncbi:MAG: hypothetical protein AABX73_04495 [Nanoarchaeota archaeon]
MKTKIKKEYKAINHKEDYKKEDEKVLFPFRRKNSQKLGSVIAMIVGVLLMVSTPIIRLSNSFTISGFVSGVIITLLGFIYFLDVQ